jgi:hypothetical protein
MRNVPPSMRIIGVVEVTLPSLRALAVG